MTPTNLETGRDQALINRQWVCDLTGITSQEHLAIFIQQDISMTPTIQLGDTIIIDTSNRTPADALFCICYNDNNPKIKRLQFLLNGKVRILSDNQHFTTHETTPENITILGRVRYQWRGIRH